MKPIEVSSGDFAARKIIDSLMPCLLRIGDRYFGFSSRTDDYAVIFAYFFYQTEKGKALIDAGTRSFEDVYGRDIEIGYDPKYKKYSVAYKQLQLFDFVSLGLSGHYQKFSDNRYIRRMPFDRFADLCVSMGDEADFDFSLFAYKPASEGIKQDEYVEAYAELYKGVKIEDAHSIAEKIRSAYLTIQENAVIKASSEFDQRRFFTDVMMSQEEVDALISFMPRLVMSRFGDEEKAFSVAIALLAAKVYKGLDFWSDFGPYLGIDVAGPQRQQAIYNKFVKPLETSQIHRGDADRGPLGFVQHIMLFVFVSDYYSSAVFKLMDSFYRNDLKMDIGNLDDEMLDFFLDGVEDAAFANWGEITKFSWNIRKHTARAVKMDRASAKERMTRLFSILDKAYYGEEPDLSHSSRRLERLLGQWLARKKPQGEKKAMLSHSPRSKFPFLHFDRTANQIQLSFPRVYFRYSHLSGSPKWHLECGGEEMSFDAMPCMDGQFPIPYLQEQTKTIDSSWAFRKIFINVENFSRDYSPVLLGGDMILFDKNGDQIQSRNGFIPVGLCFLVTKPSEAPSASSGSITAFWKSDGFDVYQADLKEGAIIISPNGTGYRAGKPFEEGLCASREYPDARVCYGESGANLWAAPPMLLLARKTGLEDRYQYQIERNGAPLSKGKLSDLPRQTITQDDAGSATLFKGEMFDLSSVAKCDGVYRVLIFSPGSAVPRSYSFALVTGLVFEFIGAPYLLMESAILAISKDVDIVKTNDMEWVENPNWSILPVALDAKEGEKPDYLHDGVVEVPIESAGVKYGVQFTLPCLYWKFSPNEEWQSSAIKDFGRKTLPERLYIKSPIPLSGKEKVSSDLYFGSYLDEGIKIEGISQRKNEGSFAIGKIKAEIQGESPIQFKLEIGGRRVELFKVIPKTILNGGNLFVRKDGSLSGSLDILGDAKFSVSLTYQGEEVRAGIPVMDNSFSAEGPFRSGTYEVSVFEEEDDGFFATKEKIGSFRSTITNLSSLANERIQIVSFRIKASEYGAEFPLERETYITGFSRIDPNDYDIIGIYQDIDLDDCLVYSCALHDGPRCRDAMFVLPSVETIDGGIVLLRNDDEEYVEPLYDKKTKGLIESDSGKDQTYKKCFIRSIDDETYLTRLSVEEDE